MVEMALPAASVAEAATDEKTVETALPSSEIVETAEEAAAPAPAPPTARTVEIACPSLEMVEMAVAITDSTLEVSD